MFVGYECYWEPERISLFHFFTCKKRTWSGKSGRLCKITPFSWWKINRIRELNLYLCVESAPLKNFVRGNPLWRIKWYANKLWPLLTRRQFCGLPNCHTKKYWNCSLFKIQLGFCKGWWVRGRCEQGVYLENTYLVSIPTTYFGVVPPLSFN